MQLTSVLTLAVLATSAIAAPKPACKNGYQSEGGGDGYLCYKVSCNKTVKGTPYKSVTGKNISDCLAKCYMDAGGCLNTTFNHATKKCTFYHGAGNPPNHPLKTVPNAGFDAATGLYDNGLCLDAEED